MSKKGKKNNNAFCIVALFVRLNQSKKLDVKTVFADVLSESKPYGFHPTHLLY